LRVVGNSSPSFLQRLMEKMAARMLERDLAPRRTARHNDETGRKPRGASRSFWDVAMRKMSLLSQRVKLVMAPGLARLLSLTRCVHATLGTGGWTTANR
jgi:hypothetical protein